MEKSSFFNTPVSEKVCVLYDPQDGRILHTHRVIRMPGGQDSTDEEIAAQAKDCAKRAGRDISVLNTLRVAAEDHDGSSHYRVDLTNMKLQKLERPRPNLPPRLSSKKQ
jgi:hypothetical protein